MFVDYGKLLFLFLLALFCLVPQELYHFVLPGDSPGSSVLLFPYLRPSCSVFIFSSTSFSVSCVSSSSSKCGFSEMSCAQFCEKHIRQSQTKRWTWRPEARQKWDFNDDLARWGVWWAGIPSVVTISNLALAHKSLPQFLTGWLIWGEQSSLMSPRFICSLFWAGASMEPCFSFLVHLFHSYVLNSQLEGAHTEILGILPSLCLLRLSLHLLLHKLLGKFG